MSWFKSEPAPPEPLYDAYRFDPKPDITTYELALILKRGPAAKEGWPFGLAVIQPQGKPIPTPEARHFVPLAKGVTIEVARETWRYSIASDFPRG